MDGWMDGWMDSNKQIDNLCSNYDKLKKSTVKNKKHFPTCPSASIIPVAVASKSMASTASCWCLVHCLLVLHLALPELRPEAVGESVGERSWVKMVFSIGEHLGSLGSSIPPQCDPNISIYFQYRLPNKYWDVHIERGQTWSVWPISWNLGLISRLHPGRCDTGPQEPILGFPWPWGYPNS